MDSIKETIIGVKSRLRAKLLARDVEYGSRLDNIGLKLNDTNHLLSYLLRRVQERGFARNTTQDLLEVIEDINHMDISDSAKNGILSAIRSAAGLTTSETTSTATTDENPTEQSDEPPEVESVEHKEPDSVFSVKCKLFVKEDEGWSEVGVGYLYIKKGAAEGSPAQLLIRADNKLGYKLLHISLNDSLPISKAPQNKGLYLDCGPNHRLDTEDTIQPTVTVLIGVKAEDTEQLFDALVKYKSNQ